MLVYAEAEFSGVKPHKHGGNESQHIKALKAMGADIPESEDEIPEELKYLYEVFMGVRFSRIPSDNGFSLMARESIGYNEIEFYSKHSGVDLELWEIDALLSLNAIFDKASQ